MEREVTQERVAALFFWYTYKPLKDFSGGMECGLIYILGVHAGV